MIPYKNLNRSSGVRAFEIGSSHIKVKFNDGGEYLYNNSSAGEQNIETMKTLAIDGMGLNGFINTYVRKNYAYKIR